MQSRPLRSVPTDLGPSDRLLEHRIMESWRYVRLLEMKPAKECDGSRDRMPR